MSGFSASLRLFVLVLLAALLATAGFTKAASDQADVPMAQQCYSVDPCRAGVPNQACCRALSQVISGPTRCSCACRALRAVGRCNRLWCRQCNLCACN